jgi:guanylate kinase
MATIPGKIYIISAASGTGKTSLAKALVNAMPNMKISISHTTRPLRNGEKADESYFFVSVAEFEKMIKQGAFLEHANVFGDYYGTSHAWVEAQVKDGFDVILDIDWQGAAQIREQLTCVTIFLLPPSKAELRRRLELRRRDDANVIEKRLAVAGSEILRHNEFDYIVINDTFETALDDLKAIVRSQRLLLEQQVMRHQQLIADLVAKY